jgi:Predicted pPIWI-associating nuclease
MLPPETIALVERLHPLLPDAFSQTVLKGSIRALQDDSNPIRANLFALGMREMVRHVLEVKAPEEEVRQCRWFKRTEDGTSMDHVYPFRIVFSTSTDNISPLRCIEFNVRTDRMS